MASMPTTTPAPVESRRARRRAYTLAEILVATSLSAVVLAGVLSSVLMISRSGYLLNNYIEMETQSRIALEQFALDVRVAQDIEWMRASKTAPLTGLTLVAPDGTRVLYQYFPRVGDTDGILIRKQTTPEGPESIIITGIETLAFIAYKIDTELIVPAEDELPTVNLNTKQVQISLSARRTRTTVVDATNNVVSARFVLRNKRVSA
ncbi:MAG: prepilin-type N-terminal cleavage/methylation domain-containing protein [Burkholderiales bacterium]|nr:prepilin-type N-terminal cleavage/methylation domain-containing protein [Opitutaceae bacterium]